MEFVKAKEDEVNAAYQAFRKQEGEPRRRVGRFRLILPSVDHTNSTLRTMLNGYTIIQCLQRNEPTSTT